MHSSTNPTDIFQHMLCGKHVLELQDRVGNKIPRVHEGYVPLGAYVGGNLTDIKCGMLGQKKITK